MRTLSISMLALLASGAIVHADGLPSYTNQLAVASPITCYIKAGALGSFQRDTMSTGPIQASLATDSFRATAGLGCDYHLNSRWLVGAFVDGDFALGQSSALTIANLSTTLKDDTNWAIGARVGAYINPALLTYAGAAYTQTGFSSFSVVGLPMSISNPSNWAGFAGVEIPVYKSLKLQLEYRHVGFANELVTFNGAPTGMKLQPEDNQLRVNLKLEFAGL